MILQLGSVDFCRKVRILAYIPSPDCVACDMEEGIAILDLHSNTYFSLDPVGASVWRAIEASPSTLDDLARGIAGEYDVTPEVCRPDIAGLLDDMMQHGLVRTA